MEVSSVPRSTRSQRSVEPGVHGATPGVRGSSEERRLSLWQLASRWRSPPKHGVYDNDSATGTEEQMAKKNRNEQAQSVHDQRANEIWSAVRRPAHMSSVR